MRERAERDAARPGRETSGERPAPAPEQARVLALQQSAGNQAVRNDDVGLSAVELVDLRPLDGVLPGVVRDKNVLGEPFRLLLLVVEHVDDDLERIVALVGRNRL